MPVPFNNPRSLRRRRQTALNNLMPRIERLSQSKDSADSVKLERLQEEAASLFKSGLSYEDGKKGKKKAK